MPNNKVNMLMKIRDKRTLSRIFWWQSITGYLTADREPQAGTNCGSAISLGWSYL